MSGVFLTKVGRLNIGADYVETIRGEGMPHFDDSSKKGDLFVEYHVVLPASLGNDQKRSE